MIRFMIGTSFLEGPQVITKEKEGASLTRTSGRK